MIKNLLAPVLQNQGTGLLIESIPKEMKMRVLQIGAMAATFVLGVGILSLVFIFGRFVMARV
jgi:hypothetical protein